MRTAKVCIVQTKARQNPNTILIEYKNSRKWGALQTPYKKLRLIWQLEGQFKKDLKHIPDTFAMNVELPGNSSNWRALQTPYKKLRLIWQLEGQFKKDLKHIPDTFAMNVELPGNIPGTRSKKTKKFSFA